MIKKDRPIDVIDKYLTARTPIYNKAISSYIETYGKEVTFYINPNHEGAETQGYTIGESDDKDYANDYHYDEEGNIIHYDAYLDLNRTKDNTVESRLASSFVHQNDVHEDTTISDNYTLAFGKDNVGFDYAKMKQVNAYLLADYPDFFKHNAGGEEQIQSYLQVIGTPISRGDIISFKAYNKQSYYRITQILDSYFDIIYRISIRLIQTKNLNINTKPVDIELPTGAVIL